MSTCISPIYPRLIIEQSPICKTDEEEVVLNIRDIVRPVSSDVIMRTTPSNLANWSFFLNNAFNWIIVLDDHNVKCLVAYKKNVGC